MESFLTRKQPNMTVKQANFNEAVTSYVVNSLRPYSTVEDKYFRDVIHTLDSNIKVMSRRNLMTTIAERAQADKDHTKFLLRDAKYVATSADIWSCSRHGYLGVIVTAILPSYKRVSRAIACRHFKNPHDGERIANLLIEIHEECEFEPPRLVSSVTDNGANIVKAFDLFGVDSIEERKRLVGSNIAALLEELESIDQYLPSHHR